MVESLRAMLGDCWRQDDVMWSCPARPHPLPWTHQHPSYASPHQAFEGNAPVKFDKIIAHQPKPNLGWTARRVSDAWYVIDSVIFLDSGLTLILNNKSQNQCRKILSFTARKPCHNPLKCQNNEWMYLHRIVKFNPFQKNWWDITIVLLQPSIRGWRQPTTFFKSLNFNESQYSKSWSYDFILYTT